MQMPNIENKSEILENIMDKANKSIKEVSSALNCLIEIISYSISSGEEINISNWFFEERLTQMIAELSRYKKSIALLQINIDNFKVINDTYGHGFGDKLLNAITLRLKTVLRAIDTLSRFGGDGFVVITNAFSDKDELQKLSERLLASIKESFFINDIEVKITASIGVAYATVSSTRDDLYKASGEALYKSKSTGKNTYTILNCSRL
jgi:diguanylate cyclase (GGDEF)-like protein